MRDTPPDPEPNVTHRIHSQWIEAPTGNYLLANIRLFANIGAPEYSVVVGQLTDKPAKAS
jgi:hypothetical protein